MNWNIIETGHSPAAYNMALDEALLERGINSVGPPVLRLYGWSPPAVTIGYRQEIDREVNVDECRRRGIDVLRRITGGGAVFHHHEITYSMIFPSGVAGGDVRESFRLGCGAVVKALERLGLDAEYAPENDVLAGGRKISGSAQARRGGRVLQHGTVMLKIDTEDMFTVLNVGPKKLEMKNLATPADRITSLENELGRTVNFEEAAAALRHGFRQMTGEDFVESEPDAGTLSLAAKLEKNKYTSDKWNRRY